MPDYSLSVKSSARKELDSLDSQLFDRIDKKILALAANPRPLGSKKLQGFADHWRIRIGNYRVIYIIDDVKKNAHITSADIARIFISNSTSYTTERGGYNEMSFALS